MFLNTCTFEFVCENNTKVFCNNVVLKYRTNDGLWFGVFCKYRSDYSVFERYVYNMVLEELVPTGVGKVQGAGAGWTGGKVRSPECRVPCTFPNRAAPLVKCRFGIPHKSAG